MVPFQGIKVNLERDAPSDTKLPPRKKDCFSSRGSYIVHLNVRPKVVSFRSGRLYVSHGQVVQKKPGYHIKGFLNVQHKCPSGIV